MGHVAVVLALTLAGFVALLIAASRATEEAATDWRAVLSPRGLEELEALKARFAAEQEMLDLAYERAQDGSDPAEVAEMLGLGYRLVAEVARDRRQLLQRAALYSRLVSAVLPLPPLRPRGFRLRGLATRAQLAALLHHLLLTTPARYRLRLSVLRRGLGIVAAALGRGAESAGSPRWQELEAARADWRTLSDETLESFRIVVTAAVEVPQPAPAPRTIS